MKQPQQPPLAGRDRPDPSNAVAAQPAPSATAPPASDTDSPLLAQAEHWLGTNKVSDLLDHLSPALQEVGSRVLARVHRLSSTQKILGGAVLILGVGYLARNGKQKRPQQRADTLHELLLFVNDRIQGYQRAAAETQDAQLRGYYQQLVGQSQRFADELNQHLRRQGRERETGTTFKGKLYRQWMDAKAAVVGHDEHTILRSNIYGEEWALQAYTEALNANILTGAQRHTVMRQRAQAQKTYRELKQRHANA